METHGYQEIEHTADWSIRVWAPDFEGLLRTAAEGMFQLLSVQSQSRDGFQQRIALQAIDQETLLVSWLEELLFYHETEGLMIDDISFGSVTKKTLEATVKFVPATKPQKHIKAVTFHNLHIQQTKNRLQTEIIFDV